MWSTSRRTRPRRALLPLALALLPFGQAQAEPQGFDPSVAQRFVLGPPQGSAPMEGLDSAASGRSRTPLPLAPVVGLRTRIPNGIAHSPATDAEGRIVVAHPMPRVSEYERSGKLVWTARLGAEAATGPVILSDRTRLVLTSNAELWGFTPAGSQRFRELLPLPELRVPPILVPLRDGGAVISNGHDVLRIGARGNIVWRDRLSSNVRAVLESRGELVAVTERGEILRHGSVTGFTTLQSFGGQTPDGAALSNDGILSAIVDRHLVVDLELASASRKIRSFEPLLNLVGPPLVLSNGETRTLAVEGIVLGHSRAGAETLRVALDAAPGPPTSVETREPRPIADVRGAMAVARRGHDVVLLLPDGQTKTLEDTSCGEPFRPTPLAPKSLLVGCRSGQVWRID